MSNIIHITDLLNNIKNKTQSSFKTITRFSNLTPILQEINSNKQYDNFDLNEEVFIYYFTNQDLQSNPQFKDNKIYICSPHIDYHNLIIEKINKQSQTILQKLPFPTILITFH